MDFVKILKLLWIFEVIIKKIHISYKMYPQTSIFLLSSLAFITWDSENYKILD
jgi:hypothetical protein